MKEQAIKLAKLEAELKVITDELHSFGSDAAWSFLAITKGRGKDHEDMKY